MTKAQSTWIKLVTQLVILNIKEKLLKSDKIINEMQSWTFSEFYFQFSLLESSITHPFSDLLIA